MFHVDLPHNIISLLTDMLSWCSIAILAMIIYQKQVQRSKIWKLILVLLIGLFSFSFTYRPGVQIAILPLGVWLLYWYFHNKGDRWQVYRKFAWLGFAANYIFLILSLLQVPLYHVIYPPNELSTYISDTEDASIVAIHPSAKSATLIKVQLHDQVSAATLEKANAEKWYDEVASLTNHSSERFPYIIHGVEPKWESGMDASIYLEK